jgi:hypothetical protein
MYNEAKGQMLNFPGEHVGIADIESLGHGHLTTLVTVNTAMWGTVSTMLRQ